MGIHFQITGSSPTSHNPAKCASIERGSRRTWSPMRTTGSIFMPKHQLLRYSTDAMSENLKPEPRWPATLALVAIGGLYYALPAGLKVGPDWLVLVLVVVLLTPTIVFHQTGKRRANQIFG